MGHLKLKDTLFNLCLSSLSYWMGFFCQKIKIFEFKKKFGLAHLPGEALGEGEALKHKRKWKLIKKNTIILGKMYTFRKVTAVVQKSKVKCEKDRYIKI